MWSCSSFVLLAKTKQQLDNLLEAEVESDLKYLLPSVNHRPEEGSSSSSLALKQENGTCSSRPRQAGTNHQLCIKYQALPYW